MNISGANAIPRIVRATTSHDELIVTLADGRSLAVPLAWFPRLFNATTAQRENLRLVGAGEGIHWPDIDEDISLAGLLRGERSPAPKR